MPALGAPAAHTPPRPASRALPTSSPPPRGRHRNVLGASLCAPQSLTGTTLIGIVGPTRTSPFTSRALTKPRRRTYHADDLISKEDFARIQAEAARIVSAPGFAAEAHRQSLLVAASDHGSEDLAFVDSLWDELFDDEEP